MPLPPVKSNVPNHVPVQPPVGGAQGAMKPDSSHNGFFESFRHAADGIRAATAGRNFRIQLMAGVVAVVAGALLRISRGEWMAVAVCIGLVLGGEGANTALESAVDLASPARHPLAKRAKDAAAGAVLFFSLAAAIVGGIIFLPRLLDLLR